MTAPTTLAQKLIARAAGRASGHARRDRHLPGRPRDDPRLGRPAARCKPMLEELGAKVWDPDKVVLVTDHYVPENDDESRRIVRIARDWAREQALPHFYDGDGHLPRGAAAARPPAARACSRRRRPPFAHRRRVRRLHVRHRRDRDARRAGDRRDLAPGAADDPACEWSGRLGRRRDGEGHDARACSARSAWTAAHYQAVEYCGEAVRALPHAGAHDAVPT